MTTITKSITAGELSDALSRVPRHTPVIVHVSLSIAAACADDLDRITSELPVENVRTHINCVELEARA